MTVTALTTFLGKEGMWRQGDSKPVDAQRAAELLAAGLVAEIGETDGATAPEVSPTATTPTTTSEARETKPAKRAKKLETK